jgi:hypothetical protein
MEHCVEGWMDFVNCALEVPLRYHLLLPKLHLRSRWRGHSTSEDPCNHRCLCLKYSPWGHLGYADVCKARITSLWDVEHVLVDVLDSEVTVEHRAVAVFDKALIVPVSCAEDNVVEACDGSICKFDFASPGKKSKYGRLFIEVLCTQLLIATSNRHCNTSCDCHELLEDVPARWAVANHQTICRFVSLNCKHLGWFTNLVFKVRRIVVCL